MNRYVINQHARMADWAPRPGREPLQLHSRLPGYHRTPLHDLPRLALDSGIASLLVKDEGDRLTLPAFKILGSSWAAYRLIEERLGHPPEPWSTLEELRAYAAELGPLTLVTASDGNHGRGVARVAQWLGWNAKVFMPKGTTPSRITAIEGDEAEVTVINGTYDDAVHEAAKLQSESVILMQDTSWEGYETIPSWIVEGYATLLWEIEEQLLDTGNEAPDLVLVPVGVGALVGAVIRHFRREGLSRVPRIIGVEPLGAECALESITFDEIVTVPGQAETIMAGLNCGTLASIVWPYVRDGLDAVIALEDEWSKRAMIALAGQEVVSGESGAAATGGLLAMMQSPDLVPLRNHFGFGASTRVLTFSTEGITDPELYQRIVPEAMRGETVGQG